MSIKWYAHNSIDSIYSETIYTVAFPGDFATGEMLRRDIGNPTWVNRYADSSDFISIEQLLAIEPFKKLMLIGYSRGGETIAQYLAQSTKLRQRVIGVIIYECPNDITMPELNIPILMIWNTKGKLSNRPAKDSIVNWALNNNVTMMIGKGKHIKILDTDNIPISDNPTDPDVSILDSASGIRDRLGHGWDISLNRRIENWIIENVN